MPSAVFTRLRRIPGWKDGDECEKGTLRSSEERSRVRFGGFRRSGQDARAKARGASLRGSDGLGNPKDLVPLQTEKLRDVFSLNTSIHDGP